MTFTHEQLLDAVRKAGCDGQPFSCAAVREHLGLATRDRRELSRFHRAFRTFQEAATDELEKIGNNSYRLRNGVPAVPNASRKRPAATAPKLEAATSAAVVIPEVPIEEPQAPSVQREEARPAARREEAPAAVQREEARPAARREETQAAVQREEAPPAARREETQAAVQREEARPAARREEAQAAVQREEARPAARHEEAPPAVQREEAETSVRIEVSRVIGYVAAEEPIDLTTEAVLLEPSAPAAETTASRDPSEPGAALGAPTDSSDLLTAGEALIEVEISTEPEDDEPTLPRTVTPKNPPAPQPSAARTTWRDRGQWLGRRVAEFFGRA